MKSKSLYIFSLLLLILWFCLINILFPQESISRLKNYSIEQGLSQSSINCIVQDSLGFIWLATQDGLDRFDGYNFYIYEPVPGDSSSISDNDIYTLYVDKSGTLWIGTQNGGLNKFNSTTGTFNSYQNNPADSSSLSSNYVTSIADDNSGNLWIGTINGLNYFDKSKLKFTRYMHDNANPNSLLSNSVYSIFNDKFGNIWVGTGKGLDLFDWKTKSFTHYLNSKNSHTTDSNLVVSIAGDNSGNLWIGTLDGLYKFNIYSKKFNLYRYSADNPNSISSNDILAVYLDKKGIVWIGTYDSGLTYYNPETNSFTRFKTKVFNAKDISGKQIISLMQDKEGILWIGTSSSGLYTYDNKEGLFQIIRTNNYDSNNLKRDIFSILEDHQRTLWYGSFSSGVYKYDRKTGKYIHYTHSSAANSISSNSIYDIFEDSRRNIWIGTDTGLDKYDPLTDSFSHFKHNPKNNNSLNANAVSIITEDHAGNLWFGLSGGGIDKYNPVSQKFTHFKHEPSNPNSLSDNDVSCLFFDNNGVLWVGTYRHGCDAFNIMKGKFKNYQNNPEKPGNSISGNSVMDIYEFPDDTSGTIWIGTGTGLTKLNTRTGKVRIFSEKNGLANDVIYAILGDHNGNLWMSTNRGISKLNLKTSTFHNYNMSDGLQGEEFNQCADFVNKEGRMFFGGINGINAFFPDSIKSNSFNPRIIFTSFRSSNNSFKLNKSIWAENEITLSYKNNLISFQFASLSYTNPLKNHFAYMLEGLNDNWIDNGTDHTVTFTNLAPGNYVLHVKGTNNDGIWSKYKTSIKIIVTPPFWQTWWFRGITVVFIIALIFFVFKMRIRTIRLQNKKLENMVSERTKELKELNVNKDKMMSVLAHDLRSPFNGLLGYTELLASDVDKLKTSEIKQFTESINHIAKNLFRLLNGLLEWSMAQSGEFKYQPSKENLLHSSTAIINLLKGNAEQKSIGLINEIRNDVFVWADKDMLEIVLRNLLSNAIKFTPAGGSVCVYSKVMDRFVEIGVKDDGIGMDEEKQKKLFGLESRISTNGTNNETGSGLGLNLCRELVIKQGGSIRIDSDKGKGTLVVVTLPKPQ